MGYERHNAIVVTSWDKDKVKEAHEQASRMFWWVSPISPEAINGYTSFFIPPDGSKEGWPESIAADKTRSAFMDWVNGKAYDDGSNSLRVVDVSFSGDGDGKIDREI